MRIPLDTYNGEQKIWYCFLIASAVKADGVINPEEVKFLIQAMHFLDASQKKRVQLYLQSAKPLQNITSIPVGISRTDLLIIFMELVDVVVSDGKLTEQERVFLKRVSNLFSFSDELFTRLSMWANEALLLEQGRIEIVEQF